MNVSKDLDALPLPPGNRTFPLLGETLAFLKDGFGFTATRVARHGPIFRTSILGKTTVVLAGPRVSGAFLDQTNVQREGSMPGHVQELFGGQSLPLLDGEAHHARKQQVLAAFVKEAMPSYLPDMQAAIERSIESWSERGEVQGTEELKRLAITVIARNVISLKEGEDLETLLDGFKAVTGGFSAVPLALPGTAYRRGLTARDAIFTILRRVVEEHRASPREDGLGRMLAFVSDDGSKLADEDAVRELHHVFIAGYIVFAELGALLERLVQRPDLREALTAEVRAKSPSGPISARALGGMALLGRVVQETKRITPVVPVSFGRAKATFAVEGFRIPEGTMLFWAPWSHDQDRLTFPDPASFDPERFGARAEDKKDPLAFAPQGMGPPLSHRCPGIDYATLFMETFAVVVLRDWSWSFPDQDMGLEFAHLPPEHADGLRMTFVKGDAAHGTAPTARSSKSGADTDMPKLGQDALLALASIIWADGVFAEEEATALLRIARASGLDDAAVQSVARATREHSTVLDAPLALDAATAEHVYSLACLLAAADGTIDPRERAAVQALGDRLALDEKARARASMASHAVAQALGASDKALDALALELEAASASEQG